MWALHCTDLATGSAHDCARSLLLDQQKTVAVALARLPFSQIAPTSGAFLASFPRFSVVHAQHYYIVWCYLARPVFLVHYRPQLMTTAVLSRSWIFCGRRVGYCALTCGYCSGSMQYLEEDPDAKTPRGSRHGDFPEIVVARRPNNRFLPY